MEVADLVQDEAEPAGCPLDLMAFSARIVWIDTGERDNCSVDCWRF